MSLKQRKLDSKDASHNMIRYVKLCQSKKHNRSLKQRSALKIPEVLLKYVSSDTMAANVRLQSGARAKGTMQRYNSTLKSFEHYLLTIGSNLRKVNKHVIKSYFIYLDDIRAKYAFVSGFKGAIMYLCDALMLKNFRNCWPSSVQRGYQAVLRRAAEEKGIVRKAVRLSVTALRAAWQYYTSPCFGNRQVCF